MRFVRFTVTVGGLFFTFFTLKSNFRVKEVVDMGYITLMELLTLLSLIVGIIGLVLKFLEYIQKK